MTREMIVLIFLIILISPSLSMTESDKKSIEVKKELNVSNNSEIKSEVYAVSEKNAIDLSVELENIGRNEVSPTSSISVPKRMSVNSGGGNINSKWVEDENKWLLNNLMPGEYGIFETTLIPDNVSDGKHTIEIVVSNEGTTRKIPLQFNLNEGEIDNFEKRTISKKLNLSKPSIKENEREIEEKERQKRSQNSSDGKKSKKHTSELQNKENNRSKGREYLVNMNETENSQTGNEIEKVTDIAENNSKWPRECRKSQHDETLEPGIISGELMTGKSTYLPIEVEKGEYAIMKMETKGDSGFTLRTHGPVNLVTRHNLADMRGYQARPEKDHGEAFIIRDKAKEDGVFCHDLTHPQFNTNVVVGENESINPEKYKQPPEKVDEWKAILYVGNSNPEWFRTDKGIINASATLYDDKGNSENPPRGLLAGSFIKLLSNLF